MLEPAVLRLHKTKSNINSECLSNHNFKGSAQNVTFLGFKTKLEKKVFKC